MCPPVAGNAINIQLHRSHRVQRRVHAVDSGVGCRVGMCEYWLFWLTEVVGVQQLLEVLVDRPIGLTSALESATTKPVIILHHEVPVAHENTQSFVSWSNGLK